MKPLRPLLAALAVLATLSAQPPAFAASLRVYVFDCGTLLDRMPIVAYLIVHPRGTLLWEAGAVPDGLIGFGASVKRPAMLDTYKAVSHRTLKSQLAEIGYTPERVTFFATSHYHFDHLANANDYTRATWLVQRPERDAMFGGGSAPPFAEPAFYGALRAAKTRVLDGDHDVFGDGGSPRPYSGPSGAVSEPAEHWSCRPGRRCLSRAGRTGAIR